MLRNGHVRFGGRVRGNGPAATPKPRPDSTLPGGPEVGVAELALDDGQQHPLARHLDRVRVPQLTRSEPPSHARLNGEPPQLAAGAGR